MYYNRNEGNSSIKKKKKKNKFTFRLFSPDSHMDEQGKHG